MSLGGTPAGTPEFRATYRALPPGQKHQTTADMQARVAAIDAQTREIERVRELLET